MDPSPAVVVSGSAGGIGTALTAALAAVGKRPIGLDVALGIDASDEVAVRDFLAHEATGGLSAVVTLAGLAGAGGVEDTDAQAWRTVVRANLDSAYIVVREALPHLRACSGDRSIVLMSSVNGRSGGNTLSGPAYATAKAGIVGLCRHLARTLADEGIRANVVAPGPVESPMYHRLSPAQRGDLERQIPLGHTIEPAEVVDAVMFLLSPSARSMTGAVLDMNGGLWMG